MVTQYEKALRQQMAEGFFVVFSECRYNPIASMLGIDGYHSVIRVGLHPVGVEHVDTSATHTCRVVVEIERVAVGQRLQLIGELALGEIVGSELIGIEIEMLVHGNLHSLPVLVQQLDIPVVGSKSVVLR